MRRVHGTVTNGISMYHVDSASGHQREFHCQRTDLGNGGCLVHVQQGRRGQRLRESTLTPNPVAAWLAKKLLNETVQQRSAQGYAVVELDKVTEVQRTIDATGCGRAGLSLYVTCGGRKLPIEDYLNGLGSAGAHTRATIQAHRAQAQIDRVVIGNLPLPELQRGYQEARRQLYRSRLDRFGVHIGISLDEGTLLCGPSAMAFLGSRPGCSSYANLQPLNRAHAAHRE